MGSKTTLGYLIHTRSPDLNLHPFVLWAKYRNVEALIAIGFRYRQPVAHALGIGLIHIGDDGVGLPTLHFLLL